MATSSFKPVMSKVVAETRTAQARRGLFIFFALLIPFTALFQWQMITRGGIWVLPLMLLPAAVSVVARLAQGEGFRDVSFRLGRRSWKALLYAWLFPVVVGFIAYGTAWGTGLAEFVPPTEVFGRTFPPLVTFTFSLLPILTIAMLQTALPVAGEEIGWRGFMLTRLIDAGMPYPLLVSGLIWALWHLPLILAGVYAAGTSPLLASLLFLIGTTSAGYVLAILRLRTGSIWPVILLHSTWNPIIQGPFDWATTGPAARLWTGESGILTAGVLLIAALVLARSQWFVQREPERLDEVPIANQTSYSS
jgi:membrane protease YdiL (CAAX protease family)